MHQIQREQSGQMKHPIGVNDPFLSETENAIVASVMDGGVEQYSLYREFLTNSHFLDANCRDAWARMADLKEQGVDWKVIVRDSGKGNPQYKLFQPIPASAMSQWMDPGFQVYKTQAPQSAWGYARPILRAFRRRLIMKAALDLFKRAGQELIFDPDESIQRFIENCYVEDNPFASKCEAAELVADYAKDLRARIEDKDSAGLPTNIASLNRMIGGLRKGNLIVIGALPSGGKTALGTNILWNLCGANAKKGLFISAEMTKEEITGRLLSLESKVSAEKILTMPGRLTNNEQSRIKDALPRLARHEFYIDDTPMPSVTQLPHMVYQARQQLGGLDFIVIDYIQYLQGDLDKNFKSRQEEISYVTRRIKSLAKAANVPVVAMAQLNREAVKSMPSLSHFQETSQIEKDADIAFILAKTSKKSLLNSLGLTPRPDGRPTYLIRVEKNRNGRTGFIEVGFNLELMFYHDIDAPRIVNQLPELSDEEERDEVFD